MRYTQTICWLVTLLFLAIPQVGWAEDDNSADKVTTVDVATNENMETEKVEIEWGILLNRAEKMGAGLLLDTLQLLEGVAPDVWSIMVFQQYSKAIGKILPPWGLLLIAFILYRQINKPGRWYTTPEENEGAEEGEETGDSDEVIAGKMRQLMYGKCFPLLVCWVLTIWALVATTE